MSKLELLLKPALTGTIAVIDRAVGDGVALKTTAKYGYMQNLDSC